MGIIVCGLNGSGKSTLGRALADALGWRFIDKEDLYFSKTDPNYLYGKPRTEEEFLRLLKEAVSADGSFVYAEVKAAYGEEITRHFDAAIVVETPREVRLERMRARSCAKFGERMQPGGDLHEQEEGFIQYAGARPEDYAERWVQTLNCPVLRVDGVQPIGENAAFIKDWLAKK